MRVCLVSTECAPFHGWGVGSYTSHMAAALRDSGHEVHVVTDDGPALRRERALPPEHRAIPGITFHVIDRASGLAALPHVPCRTTRGPMAIHRTVLQAHRDHRFEYIEFADFYGHGYFSIQARRTSGDFEGTILGVRAHSPIFELRRVNRQGGLSLHTACVEYVEAEAMRGADVIVSPSRAMLDRIRESLSRLDGPEQAVIPYPFDDRALRALGPMERTKPNDGTCEVLFYGRLEYRKGVHLLIEAVQALLARGLPVQTRLIGVDTATAPGGGSLRNWLASRIEARWRNRFVFEDNRPRGDLGRAIAQAEICCFPSLWENFPHVCLEAMAAGKAVIGSDSGGMAEIIEHGVNGLLFPGGSAPALEKALARLAQDPELRAALGQSAPARVRTLCEPRRVVQSTVRLIEDMRSTRRLLALRPRTAISPLVSVVIPFHDLGAYIPAALSSVEAQSYRPLEIVLVDDGSMDPESVSLVRRLEGAGCQGDVPVRVIRQPCRGLSAARNAGLRAARGEWVVPLDADDLLDPRFVGTAIAAVQRDPDLVLVTSWMSCFEGSVDQPTVAYVPLGLDRDMLAVLNVASSCTAAIRRDVLVRAGGYCESLKAFEDWDLYCTLAEMGLHAAVIPEFLIHNRIRPDSMLRRMSMRTREGLESRVRERHPALAVDPGRVRAMLDLLHANRASVTESKGKDQGTSLLARVLKPVLRRVARDV